jgi:hypothetical protein
VSRRSRHGRRPQANIAALPARPALEDRPVAATATVPAPDEPAAVVPAQAEPDVPAEPSGHAAEPLAHAAEPLAHAAASVAIAEIEAPSALDGDGPRTTCTQAQLRRFIKSRPWIPMHELRRRFGINGADDDVTPVRLASGTIFVGLPALEGRMLGDLLSGGDVGYELSLDPGAPIVVGVYPMRPVPRG